MRITPIRDDRIINAATQYPRVPPIFFLKNSTHLCTKGTLGDLKNKEKGSIFFADNTTTVVYTKTPMIAAAESDAAQRGSDAPSRGGHRKSAGPKRKTDLHSTFSSSLLRLPQPVTLPEPLPRCSAPSPSSSRLRHRFPVAGARLAQLPRPPRLYRSAASSSFVEIREATAPPPRRPLRSAGAPPPPRPRPATAAPAPQPLAGGDPPPGAPRRAVSR